MLSFDDAYSRYLVHHKLLISLDGQSVAVELQAALDAAKDARPRGLHDHGSEFVNRNVAAVTKTHNLIDIKTKPGHPESNRIVERFNVRCAMKATTTTVAITCRLRRSSPSSCTSTTRNLS